MTYPLNTGDLSRVRTFLAMPLELEYNRRDDHRFNRFDRDEVEAINAAFDQPSIF